VESLGVESGACSAVCLGIASDLFTAPIRDRIDIDQAFLPLRKAYLKVTLHRTESSAVVAQRVLEARERQRRRLAGSGWQTNGEVSGTYLRRHLPLPDGLQIVDEAVDRGRLSARGVDKVLRFGRAFACHQRLEGYGWQSVHAAKTSLNQNSQSRMRRRPRQ